MMKRNFIYKCLLISLLFLSADAFGQTVKKKNNYKNIIQSQNISEIEDFLSQSHPEDPRNGVLKKRLVKLKNEEWTKGKYSHSPMQTRKYEVDSLSVTLNADRNSLKIKDEEEEEFKKLYSLTSEEHKKKTVGLLNTLFNEDISSNEAVLLIQNMSSCNLIVRVTGSNQYNIAVPAGKENFAVLNKGSYHLKSNVCGAEYSSSKDIRKSMVITLNQPVMNTADRKK